MGESFRGLLAAFETPLKVLAVLADVLSLITFILVIRVDKKLQDQARSYTRQAVLPEYIKKLKDCLRSLRASRGKKNASRVRKDLALCRSNLESLAAHVDKPLRRRMVGLTESMAELDAGTDDNILLRKADFLIADLNGVLCSLENLQMELPWRKSDD
jgi:hypothetical protein